MDSTRIFIHSQANIVLIYRADMIDPIKIAE